MALRRGPRPPPPVDVFIAPNFAEFEDDALQYAAVPPQILAAARALGEGRVDAAELRPDEVFPFLADGGAAGAMAAAEAVADGVAERRAGGSGAVGEWPEAARFLDEYLKSVSELGGHADGVKSLRLHLQRTGVLPPGREEREAGGAVAGDTGEHVHVAADVAPLVEPASRSGAHVASDAATGQSDGTGNAPPPPQIRFGGPSDGAAHALTPPGRSAAPDDELWLRGRDWSRLDPGGVARARAAAAAWSRVVRRPFKRGRHVVLDLCVAAPDQRSGALERHIVARSDRFRPWLGRAAYRLARRTEWGDLWPTVYHKNFRVRRWQ